MTRHPPNAVGPRGSILSQPLDREQQKPIVVQYRLADARARDVLERINEGHLRKYGRMRMLVLDQIRRGIDPARADVAAALREAPPSAESIAAVCFAAGEVVTARDITEARWQAAIAEARTRIDRDTRDLCTYVARVYVTGTPKRPGRRAGTARTVDQDQQIAATYYRALDRAGDGLDRMAAGKARTTKTAIKDEIARRHHIRRRTLEALLKAHPRAPRKN